MFWQCTHYKERRKTCMEDLTKLISSAREKGGDQAVKHLEEILDNNCFRHTGICPDDKDAVRQTTRRVDIETIQHYVQ